MVTRLSGMRRVSYRWNICSMRWVTRKPPAMLIVASRTATAPRITDGDVERAADLQHAADDDDAADRVGDAHQRRVQRRRHVPDHLPADEAGQHEHGEVRQERRRRDQRRAPSERRARRRPARPRCRRRCLGGLASCAFGRRRWPARAARRPAARRRLAAWRRPHELAVVQRPARRARPRPRDRRGSSGAPPISSSRCARLLP